MPIVGSIAPPPLTRKIPDCIDRRFDPLKLPGQSPPLLDYFLPAPVTHRVSIPGLIIPGVLEVQYDQVVL